MALYLQDKHDIAYEIEIAKYAEEKGFSEIWQADSGAALRKDQRVKVTGIDGLTLRVEPLEHSGQSARE